MLQTTIGARGSFNVSARKVQGLTLTVYDDNNAVLCGVSHDIHGVECPIEFTGTRADCEAYSESLRELEHSFTLVTINHDATSPFPRYSSGFALGDAWGKHPTL